MAFDAEILTIVGLLRLDLPGGAARLCDGGFCDFDGERYTGDHPMLGTIAGLDPVEDGGGDLAPGGSITFLPPDGVTVAALFAALPQNTRLRGWLGEIGGDGKTVTNAKPLFDGLVDVPEPKIGAQTLRLDVSFIARAEKLFLQNRGNTLSPRFHKSIWPGELGFDNANGADVAVAWGVEGVRGVVGTGSGAMFSGDSGGIASWLGLVVKEK